MSILIKLALWAISTAAVYAINRFGNRRFREEPESGIGTLQEPVAEHGRPIPVVFGRAWVRAPQVLDTSDPRLWSHPTAPERDTYAINFHLGLCHAPISDDVAVRPYLAGLRINGVDVWPGSAGPGSGVPDAPKDSGLLAVQGGPTLVGDGRNPVRVGDRLVQGHLWIQGGWDGAPVDPNRDVRWGAGQKPAWRNLLSVYTTPDPDFLVASGDPSPEATFGTAFPGQRNWFWVGSQPRLPPMEFLVQRLYSSGINGANPVNVIADLLTSRDYGLGFASTALHTSSFEAAATRLASEGVGVNFVWDRETSIGDLMDEMLRLIDGVLYRDPESARWRLRLIRSDVDLETTPELTPSNVCECESFGRPTWAELPSQVTATWRDAETGEEESVTIHNQAAISAQGGRVQALRLDYSGVTSGELAATLASRDVIALGYPLARVTLKVKTSAGFSLRPGDVVRWTWPDYGIAQMPLRVLETGLGDGRSNAVTLRCVEDRFGLGVSLYGEPAASEWEAASTAPVAPSTTEAIELPYWLANQVEPAPTIGSGEGLVALLARRPQSLSTGYELEGRIGSADFAFVGMGSWAETVRLTAAVTPGQTSLPVDGALGLEAGSLVMLGDDPRTAEIAIVTGFVPASNTLTVERGTLDTTPRAHDADSRVWDLRSDVLGVFPTVVTAAQSVDLRPLTVTTRATLDPADAVAVAAPTVANRYDRPYPPGRLRLNGEAYPVEVERADVVVTWRHRDRTEQDDPQPEGWEGPAEVEEGVAYRLIGYDGASVVYDSGSLGDSLTDTIPAAALAGVGALRVVVRASRGGVENWQDAEHVVDVTDP